MLWEPSPLGENSRQLVSGFFLEDTGTKTMLPKGHVIMGMLQPAQTVKSPLPPAQFHPPTCQVEDRRKGLQLSLASLTFCFVLFVFT